jgi:hypothetical protein
MATVAEVAELRLLIDIPSADPPYTDEYLGSLIDTYGMDIAAATVWRQKAASYSSLVDMSESGSSRKLSQLREAALEMASGFQGTDQETAKVSFVVPIERP